MFRSLHHFWYYVASALVFGLVLGITLAWVGSTGLKILTTLAVGWAVAITARRRWDAVHHAAERNALLDALQTMAPVQTIINRRTHARHEPASTGDIADALDLMARLGLDEDEPLDTLVTPGRGVHKIHVLTDEQARMIGTGAEMDALLGRWSAAREPVLDVDPAGVDIFAAPPEIDPALQARIDAKVERMAEHGPEITLDPGRRIQHPTDAEMLESIKTKFGAAKHGFAIDFDHPKPLDDEPTPETD
jgi:hypothetical protein